MSLLTSIEHWVAALQLSWGYIYCQALIQTPFGSSQPSGGHRAMVCMMKRISGQKPCSDQIVF